MKDPTLYLVHIAECIEKIDRYTKAGRIDPYEDSLVFDAVLRNLQTLSEATQRVTDEVKARHPDIAWKRISGFRNVLVHDYLGGIDASIIRHVVEQELPPLKAAILKELPAWPIR